MASYLRGLGLHLEFGIRHHPGLHYSGRTQRVSIDGTLSMKFDLECGVPQGSCLGPLLFVVYASKIEIVDKHNLEIHCYADVSQAGFVPGNPWLNCSAELVYSQLVCLLPVGILNL